MMGLPHAAYEGHCFATAIPHTAAAFENGQQSQLGPCPKSATLKCHLHMYATAIQATAKITGGVHLMELLSRHMTSIQVVSERTNNIAHALFERG
jgi:hypothetical protein